MAKKNKHKTLAGKARTRSAIAYWKKKLRLKVKPKNVPFTLKSQAHKLLEEVFGDYNDLNIRAQMYAFLNDYTSTGHISTMTEIELKALISRLKKMI